MAFRRALLVVLLLGSAVAPAAAGIVTGTLWVSPGAAARAAAAGNLAGVARAATIRAQRGVNDAIVWIDAIPDKVERRLTATRGRWFWRARVEPPLPHVVQRDHAFAPRALPVVKGSRVAFANRDRVYHSVFSVSSADRFDLGKHAPGRADTLEFDRIGVINLHCDIHPEELGYIVVVPNHAVSRPDSLGRFALPKLPPGTYTIRAWHPRLGELHRTFDVPARGDVNFQLVF